MLGRPPQRTQRVRLRGPLSPALSGRRFRRFVARTYAQSGLRTPFFLGLIELVFHSTQRFDDLIEPRFEAEESGSGHHAQEKNENEKQE